MLVLTAFLSVLALINAKLVDLDELCLDRPLNIQLGVAIDGSTLVTSDEFDAQLDAARLLSLGALHEDDNEVLLVQHYGTTSRDSWSLDTDPFDRYADFRRGSVNTSGVDDAIDDIDGQLNEDGSDWKKVAVIFVKAALTRSALSTARNARENGLEIFIIVIGDSPGVDRDELRSLVSVPTSSHFLVAPDATRLRDHVNAVLQAVRGLDGGSTCASFGFGHFATMDGKSYTFNGHGEFWLARSSADSYAAQIRQVRCPWTDAPDNLVCARAVAITDGSERVGVYYDSRAKLLEVRVNGVPLPKRSYQTSSSFSIEVTPLNGVSGGYSFNVASLTRGHAISGSFARDGSAIFYTPDGGSFVGSNGATEGLCGIFNGCADDDFAVQGKDYIDTNVGKFGESWRVARAESIFDILPNERFDDPSWESVNLLDEDAVEDGESTSDGRCAHVASGVLRRSCQYDAEMGDDAAYAFSTREVDFFNCALLCETGLLPVPVAKETSCGCASTDFDLHAKYGKLDENDELIEPPHDLIFADGPRAFLRGALQGTYGIQLKASSCSADEITVTRKVGCVGGDDGQLELNAGSNKDVKYVDGYGYPTVTMDAVVTNSDGDELSAGSLVGVSWNYTSVPEEIESAEQLPTLFGASTLRPQWTPTLPGKYKLEVAVYDGCQIVRKSVTVDVKCAACTQEVVVQAAVPTVEWNTDDGDYVSVQAVAKNVPGFSFSYSWSVKTAEGSGLQASVDPLDENVWIIYTPSVQIGEAEITEIDSNTFVVYDDDVTSSPISAIDRPYLQVFDAGLVNRSMSQCNASLFENVTVWDPSPRVQERCRLTFSSATSRTPTITVTESTDFGFDPWQNVAGCVGDYTIVMTAEDSCNTKVDEFVLSVSCSAPPVPVLSCSHDMPENVTHVPGGSGFASVSFNGDNSYDPDLADPSALEFEWYYEAGQDETVPVSTFTCTDGGQCRSVDFTPAAAGTYEIILSASDGCQSRNTSHVLEVFCADIEPTIDISVAGSNPTFTMSVDASSGAGVVTSFEIEQPASRQLLVDFGIIGDFPQPTDPSVDTTTLDYEGDYVITGVAFDGCARAEESITVTRECPTNPDPMDASFTASPSVSGGTVEISWDEDAEAYEDVWFNASLVPAGATAHWLLTDHEANSTTRVSTLSNYFFPTSVYGEGEYHMDLVVEDGCRSFTAAFDIVIGPALSGSSVAECVSTSTLEMAAGADVETSFANGKFAEVSLRGSTPNATFVNLITEYHWRFVDSPVGSVYQAPTWSFGSVSFDAEVFVDETFPGGEGINETVLVNTTRKGACDNSWVSFAFLEEPSTSAVARELFPACFTPDLGGTYEVQLIGYSGGCIIDGGTLIVTASCNAAPALDVSAPSVNSAKGGFTRAVLDASGTTDADNETLVFRWEQVSAPKGSAAFEGFAFLQEARAANFSTCESGDDPTTCINGTIAALTTQYLTNPSGAVASFVPDAAGDWVFTVTVTDGCSVVTETVTVDVGCSGGSGSLKVNGDDQVIIEDTLGAEALELVASDECASEYEWTIVSFDDAAPALSTGDALTAGAIAGIVIGALVCLAICIVAVVMAAKKGIIGKK